MADPAVSSFFPTPSSFTIRGVLKSGAITPYFQPILSARQRTVIGVEALARYESPEGVVVEAPQLFRMAAAEGLTVDLERECRERAIERFAYLACRREDQILFLNLGSELSFDAKQAVDRMTSLVAGHRLAPQRVAIEILEAKIDNVWRLRDLVGLLRQAGFLVVLDDVGAGHSNLDRVPLLQPDILKIDRSLMAQIDRDFFKQETLKSLVSLGRKIGSLVVAEGLETEAEAMTALELGADFLQGFFLGRSDRDASALQDEAKTGIHGLAQKFKTHMVGKINRRKLQHRRFNIVMNEVLFHLGKVEVEQFDKILHSAIQQYPSVECMYVLDNTGVQITDTVWNPGLRKSDIGPFFRPAPKGADHSLKEYYFILLDVELQKYTTEPYVSYASGNLCRTISTYFRDVRNNTLYVLCIDVLADD